MRTNKYTQRRKGIVTPYGQWKYPGKVTTIPSNDITMQGVPYPVLGVSDAGDMKMMMPGMNYLFKGNEVTEYPMMQTGGYDYSTFFSNADKNKRGYDKNAMLQLDKYWADKGLNENQRKALMYNVLIESQGGKYLDAHGNGYYGLLGFEPRRYEPIKNKTLEGQAEYIYDTLRNGGGGLHWTDGSKGSGYQSWKNAYDVFWNPNSSYEDVNRALIYGYIRPGNREKRLNEGNNYYQTGGIHINPKNKGKFTAAAKRAGKSVQAYAAQILANKENYSPTLVKRAVFARNSAKWKHQEGGIGKYLEGNYVQPQTVGNVMNSWNDMLAKGLSKGDNAANIAGTILGFSSMIGGAAANQWGAENGKQDWMKGKKQMSSEEYLTSPQFGKDLAASVDDYEDTTEYAELPSEVKQYQFDSFVKNTPRKELNDNISLTPVINRNPTINPFDIVNEINSKKIYPINSNQEELNSNNYNLNLEERNNLNITPIAWNDNLHNLFENKWNYYDNQNKVVKEMFPNLQAEKNNYLLNRMKPFIKRYFQPTPTNFPKSNDYIPVFATGGNTAQLANVEHKEIIDDGTKAVVDGKYHENFTDNAEKNGTTINLSGSVSDLLKNNPHLKSMSEATKGRLSNRTNKYTSARRKGIPFVQLGGIMKPVPFYNEYTLASGIDGQEKKWIWPSTVTIGGEITEPRKGADYPLARYINDNILT